MSTSEVTTHRSSSPLNNSADITKPPERVVLLCSSKKLFFRLLEYDVLASLWVVLLELDFASDKLFVLACPIHLSGAFILELYEKIL